MGHMFVLSPKDNICSERASDTSTTATLQGVPFGVYESWEMVIEGKVVLVNMEVHRVQATCVPYVEDHFIAHILEKFSLTWSTSRWRVMIKTCEHSSAIPPDLFD